jgi:hypothetical protein
VSKVLDSLTIKFNDLVGDKLSSYLKSRKIPYAISLLLILGFLYQQLTGILFKKVPIDYSRLMIYALLICLAILLFKLPRIVYYLAISLVLIIHLFYFTQFISNLDQDQFSTRDDAVELSTRALINGENPWNNVPDLDVPATTGPASILFALPSVLIFGKINILTFVFWIVFFLILLFGDIGKENNTFPILVMLFVIGIFEFSHSLFWSLDELYFPFALIPIAVWGARRKRWILVGIILSSTIFFRLNYIFVVIGFLLWFLFNEEYQLSDLWKIGLGAVIAGVIILLPFIIVGGQDFLNHNPFIFALSIVDSVSLPNNNIFYQGLNYIGNILGFRVLQILKLVFILGVMLLIAVRLRNIRHPYWHVTAGAFLAQSIAWVSLQFPKDYALFFVLPVFLAISNTKKEMVG